MRSFITAFNGARDFFEIPKAMHERGLLEKHVTDLAFPGALGRLLSSIGRLSLRAVPEISAARLHLDPTALLDNVAVRLSRQTRADPYFSADRALSLAAGDLAVARHCHLFLYSGYGFWAFDKPAPGRKLLFQVHPHPLSVFALLSEDARRFPEVAHSFETELDSLDPRSIPTERSDEWRLADRIACASTFTRNSLITQGCEPGLIDVVPYGFRSPSRPAKRRPASGRCRFLFVGQGVQRKGLHHLLRVWRDARPANSELIVIARRLDPGLDELLRQTSLQYYPGVSATKLEDAYASSDVFVMPSLVEGYGLVYLEALSHGLVCIGTKNTGLADIREARDRIRTIEAGDLGALAEEMGRAASELAVERERKPAPVDWRKWSDFRSDIVEFATRGDA